jgi:hypothetical protein
VSSTPPDVRPRVGLTGLLGIVCRNPFIPGSHGTPRTVYTTILRSVPCLAVINRVINPATATIQPARAGRNPPSRVDIILGGWIQGILCDLYVQIVKKGSKIDIGQQQTREKNSSSDTCRKRVKWRHGKGHWNPPTSKKEKSIKIENKKERPFKIER